MQSIFPTSMGQEHSESRIIVVDKVQKKLSLKS